MFPAVVFSALVLGQGPTVPGHSVPALPVATSPTDSLLPQTPGNPYAQVQPGLFPEAPKEQPRTNTIVGTPYPLSSSSEGVFSGSVTLNQDSFFGFYPILNGSYSINDRFALTFYGLFWTNPGFTPRGMGATGLWTEVAVGVSFTVLEKVLSVNPAIGFLNGALLSGASRPIAFEGVVSQLSFSHAGQYTEGQVFAAYYASTAAPSKNNFFHWWGTAGFRPFAESNNWTQIFSLGAHFEQLYQTKSATGATGNLYTWVGPYFQLTLPNSAFLRVSTGRDLQNTVAGSFYKATIGYVF